jgi:hypothetical protein
MVGMAPRLCIVLSCLLLALLGGCSSGSQAAKCVPGASVACACSTSQQGAQICNSAGTTFGACTCSVPPSLDAAADVPTAASDLANESHLGPDAQPDTQILGSNTPEPGRDSGAGTEVKIVAAQPDAQPDSSSVPPLLTIAANYTSSSDLGSEPPGGVGAERVFVVTNVSHTPSGPLTISIVPSANVTISSDTCTPAPTLPFAGTCTIGLQLTPAHDATIGPIAATLTATAAIGSASTIVTGTVVSGAGPESGPDAQSAADALVCPIGSYIIHYSGTEYCEPYQDAGPDIGMGQPDSVNLASAQDSGPSQQVLDADAIPSVFDVCGDTAPQYDVSCDGLGCKCILVPFDLYYQLCDPTSYKPCAGLFNSWGEPLICETVTIVCQDSTSHSTFGCSEGPGPSAVPLHVSNCQPG